MNLEWFAGYFEGEGNIAFTGANSVCISVNSTDYDVLEKCVEATGTGSIWGPYKKQNGSHKDQWKWSITQSDQVCKILVSILPMLGSRRRERAKAAILRLQMVRKQGFCKRNHPLEGDNLYVSPGGQRQCRACQHIRRQRSNR